MTRSRSFMRLPPWRAPPRWAALHAFGMGEEMRASHPESESIPAYQLAIDLDPQFAMAYARLGTLSMNVGDVRQAIGYYRKGIRSARRLE